MSKNKLKISRLIKNNPDQFVEKYEVVMKAIINKAQMEEVENFKADFFLDSSEEDFRAFLWDMFCSLNYLDWKQKMALKELNKRLNGRLDLVHKFFNDFDEFMEQRWGEEIKKLNEKRELLSHINPEDTVEVAKAEGMDMTSLMNDEFEYEENGAIKGKKDEK